jgi:hypothetical protein
MARALGKLPAVADTRVPMLAHRMDLSALPTLPQQCAWYADLPDAGVPMLGNDTFGCCVEASICHYLQEAALYQGVTVTPSEAECLKIYSDVTGFDPTNPATDQGTYFMGPGGMIEHWTKNGVLVGGALNKCGPVVQVRHTNPAELQAAIYLFGFVFVGAQLTQDDVDSDFLWTTPRGQIIGGHEFLICGYEKTANATRYDVLTWDGIWRTTDAWIAAAVDEACAVFDPAFFNARGVSPGGLDQAALLADQRLLA